MSAFDPKRTLDRVEREELFSLSLSRKISLLGLLHCSTQDGGKGKALGYCSAKGCGPLRMTGALFPYLPKDKILAAFEKSPGNELSSGKFENPESSAALAANTFGFFIDRPTDLPPIPGTEHLGWPATSVGVEQCARFPWSGGHHPWLDAFVETSTHIIGIESKRFEPYRTKNSGSFSEAYWRPVWGDQMAPFERMRDHLSSGDLKFERLDAVQLVKHAFGLRTEGHRRHKASALIYLYAEPENWPDGRVVSPDAKILHTSEARRFLDAVAGAEVEFQTCAYGELLRSFCGAPHPDVRQHGDLVKRTFNP